MEDEEITALIELTKTITAKKFHMTQERNGRNTKTEISLSPKSFHVFIRINAVFPENFSIGLMYKDNEGKNYQLLRVNGEQLTSHIEHHRTIHYHILKQSDIENGRSGKPSKRVILEKVKNFTQALEFFCQKTNIANYKEFFGEQLEPTLF